MADEASSSRVTQTALNAEERPRYSKEQLLAYFKRIGLPQEYLDSPLLQDPVHARSKEHGLPFLRSLMCHHLSTVPFENLLLHYDAHKVVTLDPQDLFQKFVHQRRGGRCMENNSFFSCVLRSLGYEVRNCGGRVSRAMSPNSEIRRTQGSTYDGWNHMLNLLRMDDQWYVVDVGMGSMGPNLPYPLEDGYETTSISPRRLRLQLRTIAESYSGDKSGCPKLWCYDVCNQPGAEGGDTWIPTYCFTETEFLPQDYEVMSWYTSYNKRCFFTTSIICTRMLADEAKQRIVGDITLFQDAVRKTVAGDREVLVECKTEQERVKALEDIFGIVLSEEQQNAIHANLRLG